MEGDMIIYLDEGEVLPMWYKGDKDKIMLKSGNRKGNTSRYDCENVYVGEDENYKFYLNEVGFTDDSQSICPLDNLITISDKFKIILVCKLEPKTENAIRYHLNAIILSYNMLFAPN